MNNDFFNILLTPHNHFKSNDLSPEQKKKLYALMMKHGASYSLGYDRFFKEGFDKWEMLGINTVKKHFLQLHNKDIAEAIPEDGNGNDRGYAAVLELEADKKGGFWNMLSQVYALKSTFRDYMYKLGMLSGVTIMKRFKTDDWKEWELIGINNIIDEFINDEKER